MNVRWCDGMCEPQPVGMPLQTVSFTASPPRLEEFHTASASRFIAVPAAAGASTCRAASGAGRVKSGGVLY